MFSSMASMHAWSMMQEAVNFSPPWSTRWPTAPISEMEEMTPCSLDRSASSTRFMASVWSLMASGVTV